MQTITINSNSFNVDGLKLHYTFNGERFSINYDAKATANLFTQLGIIEDFAIDNNGEPVVLITDNFKAGGYDYQTWCDFVKTYPFTKRHFEIMAEAKEEAKQFARERRLINQIKKHLPKNIYLQLPKQAA